MSQVPQLNPPVGNSSGGPPAATAPPISDDTLPRGLTWDSTPYRATDSFTYAWERLRARRSGTIPTVLAGVLVVLVLIPICYVLLFAIALLFMGLGMDPRITESDSSWILVVLLLVVALAVLAAPFSVLMVVSGSWAKAGIETTRGLAVKVPQAYAGWRKRSMVSASLLVAVLLAAPSSILATIPSVGPDLAYGFLVVAGFFLQFTVLFIVGRGLDAVAALGASFALAGRHLIQVLSFDLLAVAVTAVGVLLFGVGVLFTTPLVVIAASFTWRKLQGLPVAR